VAGDGVDETGLSSSSLEQERIERESNRIIVKFFMHYYNVQMKKDNELNMEVT
jgi:hypothetical protein